MVYLPNRHEAVLEIRKIADYCLSPTHPRGRHKARLFRELLGIGPADADWLRRVILEAVRDGEALELVKDTYGSRWRVDIPVRRQGKNVVVRTIGWCGTKNTLRVL
jgi:hypothetical protein